MSIRVIVGEGYSPVYLINPLVVNVFHYLRVKNYLLDASDPLRMIMASAAVACCGGGVERLWRLRITVAHRRFGVDRARRYFSGEEGRGRVPGR
jgi:hypothetical protein